MPDHPGSHSRKTLLPFSQQHPGCVALFIASFVGPFLASAQSLPPTPQQLQSLAAAVSAGQKENIVNLFSVQNTQELAVVSSFADLASAKHQLSLAVFDRFGQKGKDYLFSPTPPPSPTPSTQPNELPPPPIPAAWLIGQLSLDAAGRTSFAPAELVEMTEVLKVQTRVFAHITQLTRDGKFSTPQELGQMLRSQLALALVPAEPATNPTTQPTTMQTAQQPTQPTTQQPR